MNFNTDIQCIVPKSPRVLLSIADTWLPISVLHFILKCISLKDRILVTLSCGASERAQYRKHQPMSYSYSDDYLTQFSIFAQFHADPLSSPASSINVVRIQRQAETRANPTTTITQCVRPARGETPDLSTFRAAERAPVACLAVRGGMSRSWWLIIGRGKSRRYVVLSASVAASVEMRSATRSCRRVRISTTKTDRDSEWKKGREWSRGRETTPKRQAVERTDRRSDSGR